MAIYVLIRKKEENDSAVKYEFGPTEERLGVLEIAKDSGEVSVLTEVPDDGEQVFSLRAHRKVIQHWRQGQFPDETCWAS